MGTYVTNWEDEENNRIVGLAVDYKLDNDQVELLEVTPSFVTFIDPQSNLPIRRINVHTNGGRRVLAKAYTERVGTDKLEQEIVNSNATSC